MNHGHLLHLALGTNLADRAANLRHACEALPPAINIIALSPVYETPPWGVMDQPAFLNQVIRAHTTLAPLEVLAHCKQIEHDLGRLPSVRYGPRLIDLDLLFYDDLCLDLPEITLPHPRLHERAFVLVPLNDLSPLLVHPRLGQTIATLLQGVDVKGITRHD